MLRGIPVSEGIGIGKVFVVGVQDISFEHRTVEDTEVEKKRFHDAVEEFCRRNSRLAEKMTGKVDNNEIDIIKGHEIMLRDPFLISQTEEKIDGGMCAEAACSEVMDMFISMFSAADDELTRQRAADIEDIRSRVLKILAGADEVDLSDIPADSIVVMEELTPSVTAELDRGNVNGIITEKGGITSHSAILARAMEIPAVLSVENALSALRDGSEVIVDGNEGTVTADPDQEELEIWRDRQKNFREEQQMLENYKDRESLTADGVKKEVFCNIGSIRDAVTALEKHGEGIGLFRTEFIFMECDSAPDEETQFEIYRKAAELFGDRGVIIRTLDAGGDKGIEYLGMAHEDNPFLGFRAIRYCLAHEDIFRTQLRAILRASAFGSIRIMIPLVTEVAEIRRVRTLTEDIKKELRSEGVAFDEKIKIGAMIETPAACMTADILADECDFFSIGTNDLTQYTMAADRGNRQVGYLNDVFEPAVLRAISYIIKCAGDAGIPVGMCGEAAADPRLTPLLISFGLDEFSVSPSSVLRTRYNISLWTGEKADKVTAEVMGMTSADDIKAYLTSLQSR